MLESSRFQEVMPTFRLESGSHPGSKESKSFAYMFAHASSKIGSLKCAGIYPGQMLLNQGTLLEDR